MKSIKKIYKLCNFYKMKFKQLGANKTLLTLKNGVQVFLSYETPVAARLENFEYVRTNQSWSRTTSRHITQWLEGVKAKTVEQSFLDNLLGA